MQIDYESVVREFVEVAAPRFIEEGKRFYSPKQYKSFVEKIQRQVEEEAYIGFAANAAENLLKEVPKAFEILGKVEKGKTAEASFEYASMSFMDKLRIYEFLENSYYALDLLDVLKQTMVSSLEGVFPENSPSQRIIIKNETSKLEKIAKKNKREGTQLQTETAEVQQSQQVAN